MKYDDAQYYMNPTLAVTQLRCKYYQANLFPLSNIFVYPTDIRMTILADCFYNPQSPNALKGMDNGKLEGESLEEHPSPLKGLFSEKYYVRFSSTYQLGRLNLPRMMLMFVSKAMGVENNRVFRKKRHRLMRPTTIGLASVQFLSNYPETGFVSEDATRLSCL
ncbi:hypothetical protein BGX38DRAFT_1268099 [Terfezia claveryi]|nr:hypothetical protein BGX38DRAFT_1268099 [Terfezia claveryi]